MTTKTLTFDDATTLPALYGEHNANIKALEELLDVTILCKSNEAKVSGSDAPNVALAAQILENLYGLALEKGHISEHDIKAMIRFTREESGESFDHIIIKNKKREVRPRTPKQAKLIEAIQNNDLIFAIGPAGTGKTYLAVAMAVELFQNGDVERMIFARPAVEAGERLGYLPGDMQEKIAPYLQPIYDALLDVMYGDKIEKAKERNEIEIAPLAFMRGRTLNHAAVVLDEAQNTTPQQMKMLLTRFGEESKMIIAGDPTQADLPPNTKSGLQDAMDTLQGVKGTAFIHFDNEDVVRHDLVSRILKAYDKKHGTHN